MQISVSLTLIIAILSLLCLAALPSVSFSQSTDQNFPTPVSSSEISGMIRPRDVGDPRLTTYFYAFGGGQGDLFINVVTRNLTGDIDIFTADSMQPLSKIVVYADAGSSETGRLLYLRKPARLMLRVEGRSPNDDPATFQIKFAGSFIALREEKTDLPPSVESGDRDRDSGIRVNSVGTIVKVVPRAKETSGDAGAAETKIAVAKQSVPEEKPETSAVQPRPVPEVKTIFGRSPSRASGTKRESGQATAPSGTSRRSGTRRTPPRAEVPVSKPVEPDPLANIRLVIELKEGGIIERPMNEVLRFSVDKGVLTVVTSDGKTARYSILLVDRVTIK